MTALIVDDERLARAEVKRLLGAHPWVEVVGEAADSTEALEKLHQLQPELLFLDIELPGSNGFRLLEQYSGQLPHVIFTTAYDEFAIRAFEVNAVDYLLKPITPERMASALGRVQEDNVPPAAVETPLRRTDRVLVRDGNRCWFILLADIFLFESEGNYTRIHFEKGQPLIYRSLSALEQRLPEEIFFRINRQQIVNLEFIEKVENWFSGGLKIWLRNGPGCEVSRRAARLFRQRLSL
jgi:two-component system LytT family response regulator